MRDAPSLTAEAVCLMRAMEQSRDPAARILDDPYAELFLGPVVRAALMTFRATGDLGLNAHKHLPGVSNYVVARHRFIDETLKHALDRGKFAQVVLLGAGYDTRAYRFAQQLAGVMVFEVDHPSTSKRKAKIVEQNSAELPQTHVTRVEVNFETDSLEERLVSSGFSRGARTFVVWEGVSMYLRRDAIKATLSTIHSLTAPGSELAMDFWFMLDDQSFEAQTHRLSPNLLYFLGEPITFGIHPEDAGDFFRRQNYRLIELADAAALERRYVRDDRKIYPANYVVHVASTEPHRSPA